MFARGGLGGAYEERKELEEQVGVDQVASLTLGLIRPYNSPLNNGVYSLPEQNLSH